MEKIPFIACRGVACS